MPTSTNERRLARYADDAARWAAILGREADADGHFYYSVRTTGVYCRPSCAARPARRENVRFHKTSDAAAAAGFRACKRCRPDTARVQMMVAIADCALGKVLVAATGRGVCAILPGDDADALHRDLRRRFPTATVICGNAAFERTVARVTALLAAPHRGLDVPLDPAGTPFQRRVWQALGAIRAGTTASYGEIARRIGAPRAVRAVAQACAANPIAVAIPCHRVVRRDGAPGGYRWGVARKQALLEGERGA